jgi:isoamylase
LPRVGQGSSWRRWVDTALESPHDIVPWQTAPVVSGSSYRVEARSVVFLYAAAPSLPVIIPPSLTTGML